MHVAYIYGNSSNTSNLMQTLIQYGAISNIPDYNGKMAIDYTRSSKIINLT